MEFNPLDFDDQLQDSSGRGRTYTCAFCKRGFSNAQALGGHMNIHRRDRARLRQAAASEEEQEEEDQQKLSLDLSTGSRAGPSHDHQDMVSVSSGKRPVSDEAISGAATTDIDSGTEEVQRVTLSLDAKIGEEKTGLIGGEGGSGSSGQAELVDLELRLGPEPHDTTSKKSTRLGFF